MVQMTTLKALQPCLAVVTTNYKKAIAWATVTTFAGSIAAIFLAGKLVKNFSGKGLVPDTLIQSPEFAISIVLGAALTVFIATKMNAYLNNARIGRRFVWQWFGCRRNRI